MDVEQYDDSLSGMCKDCDRYTLFRVKGGHRYYHDPSGMTGEYVLGVCDECSAPSLFLRVSEFGDDYGIYSRVYPPNERAIHFRIPERVKQSYDEAVKCEIANAWLACVAMVGRALEAITKEYAPKSTSIYKGLLSMKTEGIIGQEIYEWAEKLRNIRNIGAHITGETVSKDDAKDSLDFLQVILETLYHLRPKYEAMNQRRTREE